MSLDDLQSEKLHQMEQALEKAKVAFQAAEEEALKARKETQAFKNETTQAEGELISFHAQKGDLCRDLSEAVLKGKT